MSSPPSEDAADFISRLVASRGRSTSVNSPPSRPPFRTPRTAQPFRASIADVGLASPLGSPSPNRGDGSCLSPLRNSSFSLPSAMDSTPIPADPDTPMSPQGQTQNPSPRPFSPTDSPTPAFSPPPRGPTVQESPPFAAASPFSNPRVRQEEVEGASGDPLDGTDEEEEEAGEDPVEETPCVFGVGPAARTEYVVGASTGGLFGKRNKRINWTVPQERTLLSLLANEVVLGNRRNGTFGATAHNNVKAGMLVAHPELKMDMKQMKYKIDWCRRNYGKMKKLRAMSGAGWENGKVTLPNSVWETLARRGSKLAAFRGKEFIGWEDAVTCWEGALANGEENWPVGHPGERLSASPPERNPAAPEWEATPKRRRGTRGEEAMAKMAKCADKLVLAVEKLPVARDVRQEELNDVAIARIDAFDAKYPRRFHRGVYFEASMKVLSSPSLCQYVRGAGDQKMVDWLSRIEVAPENTRPGFIQTPGVPLDNGTIPSENSQDEEEGL